MKAFINTKEVIDFACKREPFYEDVAKVFVMVLAIFFTFTLTSCNNNTSDGIIPNAVTDIDGNRYNAVKLGKQVWMAENLRTTRYADGNQIPLASGKRGDEHSSTIPCRYYPDNNSDNVYTYGYLYNWKAVMGNSPSSSNNPSEIQGICPDGWHVPSYAEWNQLQDYLFSKPEYGYDNCNDCIAKSLASNTGWCYGGNIANNANINNATGFSAVPAGRFSDYTGCCNLGMDTWFWSTSTTLQDGGAASVGIVSWESHMCNCGYEYSVGCSVRCIKD